MSQYELAREGGPSAATVRNAEQGQGGPYRAMTIMAFEKSLRWQPGSFLRVLEGGDATIDESAPATPARSSSDWARAVAERLDELQARLAAIQASEFSARSVEVPEGAWMALTMIANREKVTISEALANAIDAYQPEREKI